MTIKEQLVAAAEERKKKLVAVDVTLPNFDEKLFVKVAPAADIEWALGGEDDWLRVRVACVTLCDANGDLVFSREDEETVNALGMPLVRPIWDKATPLNGFRKKKDEDPGKN